MTLNALLDRLDAVHVRGRGRWSARCPAHSDRTPSLSVTEGEKGILVKCWAGCALQQIVAAIGLNVHDLFYDRPSGQRTSRPDLIPHAPDWRRQALDLLAHAEALRLRSERVFEAATGLSIAGWSDRDLDEAIRALAWSYECYERAALLEDVAFTIRHRWLHAKGSAR